MFAFGNSLGDLVANLALARVHPHMALAACFATPLLNLTLGVGLAGSLTILFPLSDHSSAGAATEAATDAGGGEEKTVTVHATAPLLIAGGGTVLSLALLFMGLVRSKWTLTRTAGYALCSAYAIMFAAGLVTELVSRYASATTGPTNATVVAS